MTDFEYPDKVLAWEYECGDCGHITYLMVGGAQDVICHGCWNFNVKYLGKKMISVETLKESQ